MLSLLAEWTTYLLYYLQPGVDRQAVFRTIILWFPHEPPLGLWCWYVSIFVIPPLLTIATYWLLYSVEHPWIERYRVSGWKLQGWNHPDPTRRQEYIALTKRALPTHIIGPLFQTIFFGLLFWITRHFGWWTHQYVQELIDTVPSRWTSIWQIGLGLLIFDTGFYWTHRAFHSKYLYSFHKRHHTFRYVNVLSGGYGDALDGLVTSHLPGLLPLLFYKMHPWTYIMYLNIHFLHTYVDHSGYQFPWCPFNLIPGSNHAYRHHLHHSVNTGNYGVYFTFWDTLMGTSILPSSGILTISSTSISDVQT